TFVEFALLRRIGLTDVDNLVAINQGSDDFLEELRVISVDLAGEQEATPEPSGDGDRMLRPLLRCQPAEKEQIVALRRLEREGVDVNRVVDVAHIPRLTSHTIKVVRFRPADR